MVEVSRLYLKTIEMQGFKSFAEKSVISFEPGVTAIVGPNGSGKSNISDAVRWVLGEMSAKSLRGGKMEDVIFNGTARRRPAAYAEVVLTIDNSNQVLEGAGQEVAVGRRLYRSGESEYSINGQVVRLKDVVNLFLNTGIGREGYSVIGQGKIAEIISQKGEERRGVFEEAAGISRYRYRKNEAQNKLAQFRENAIRISDIINEVQSRIPLLERQSEKAVQYEELVSERRLIEVSLLVKKLAKLDTERAQCLEKYEFRAEELRQLQEKLESIDGEMEARYRENQQENLLLAQKRALLEDTIREESTLSGRISVLENDIAHFKNAMTLNQGESGEQEKQKKELNLSLQKLEETIGNRRLELASSEQSLLRMQEGLQARERELNQLRGVIASAEAEISLLEENLKQAELEQRESESTNRLRGDRVQAIRRDLSFIANNVLKEEQELSDLQAFLQKTENNRAEILQKCQQNKEKMAECEAQLHEALEIKQKKRLQVMSLQQRRETLQRMDRLMEGFSGSVKAVLNAGEDHQLSGIFGPVSKLISTDEEYVTAIETTLGAGMQNIVVSDESAAKDAIAYLRRTNNGRATFLPLTTVKGRPWDDRTLKEKKGFVAMANHLVHCEDRFRDVVDYMLGRTIVANSIDNGASLAKSQQFQCRVVTLDGQLINVGGSYTGGQVFNKTGILSRTGDIARLKKEEQELQKQIGKCNLRIDQLQSVKNEFAATVKTCEQELAGGENNIGEIRTSCGISSQRLADHRNRQTDLEQELSVTEQSTAFTSETLSKLQGRGAEISEKLLARKGSFSDAKEKENKLLSLREAEITQCTEASLGLGMDKREVERLGNDRKVTAEKLSLLNVSMEEKEKRVVDLQLQIQRAEAELEACRKKLAENVVVAATIRQALSDATVRQEEADKQGYELRGEHKVLVSEKEKVFEVFTRLQSKLEELKKEFETSWTKLREEHEMERDEAEEYATAKAEEYALVSEPENRLAEVKQKLKSMGSINPDAVTELTETKERYEFLKNQYDDVEGAAKELEKLISSLEDTMKNMFMDTFIKVREQFKVCFIDLFGGGTADIILSDENDPLNGSIDIKIQPPGKLVKTLALLSGGEQAFVAIALYFSLLAVNPAPFCIFDEIESALDEANVYRFGDYLKKGCRDIQFIVITHRRGTMECADTLYGITMQEKGVSDFIKLSIDDVQARPDIAQ